MELATSTFRDEPVRDWGWQYRIVIMNFDYELVEDDHALASDESSEHRQHTRLLVDQLFTERKVRMDFGV